MDLVKFVCITIIISPLLVIQQKARAAPVCKDLDSKCSHYDATYCNYHNIKQQCPLTCNQCGTLHPSSPVTSMTSSHLIDATQSTAVVSQSLTVAQNTVLSTSQVTPVSQSLTPRQGTVSTSQVTPVSQSLVPTQSTVSTSQVNSVSQSVTPTYSTVSTSQVTSVSQSLVPTQNTLSTSQVISVFQSLTPTHSTSSTSQVTSVSQSLTPPTQSTASISPVLTQSQSSVDLSQGLFNSPPTQNTDVLQSSSAGLKTHRFTVRASASKTTLTQANVLITLGILWSYLIYWR